MLCLIYAFKCPEDNKKKIKPTKNQDPIKPQKYVRYEK